MSESALTYVAGSPIHGKGLFASESISEGAYVGFYEGTETQTNGMYVLWVQQDASSNVSNGVSGIESDGEIWLGFDGTGDLRFLNHGQPANCEMDGQDCYASRDIQAGDELTIDYGEWFEP